MEGAIIMLIVIAPIAGMIIIYRFLNHGKLPCLDMSYTDKSNRIAVENV